MRDQLGLVSVDSAHSENSTLGSLVEAHEYLVLDVSAIGAVGGGQALEGVDLEPLTLVRTELLTSAEALDLNRAPHLIAAELLPVAHVASVPTPRVGPPPSVSWGVEAINATASDLDGHGVCVAILDSGVDAKHPAFTGVEVVQQCFVPGSPPPGAHATHCAATILGRDVDGVRIGVARGVSRLLDAQVIGGGTQAVVDGVMWAASHGAHVISMSLGIDFPGFVTTLQHQQGLPPAAATSRALVAYRRTVEIFEHLAAIAEHSGTAILVAAAGNSSNRAAEHPYVLDCEPPATSAGVIAVGALAGGPGLQPHVSGFSNQGVALAAPGEGIWSASGGGGLAADSGTSTAVPHVAGVAALWAQRLLDQHGTVGAALLRARLVGNARELPGSLYADVGAGLVQAP